MNLFLSKNKVSFVVFASINIKIIQAHNVKCSLEKDERNKR
jgi:hypothetical protein